MWPRPGPPGHAWHSVGLCRYPCGNTANVRCLPSQVNTSCSWLSGYVYREECIGQVSHVVASTQFMGQPVHQVCYIWHSCVHGLRGSDFVQFSIVHCYPLGAIWLPHWPHWKVIWAMHSPNYTGFFKLHNSLSYFLVAPGQLILPDIHHSCGLWQNQIAS